MLVATLGGALLCLSSVAPARAQDIEDLPLDDAPPPLAPAPAAPPVAAPKPPPAAPEAAVAPTVIAPVLAPPIPVTPAATVPANGDTVTVPREVFEQLLRDVAELKAARANPATAPGAGLPGTGIPGTPNDGTPSETQPAPLTDTVGDATGQPSLGDVQTATEPAANRNYLLLPDISLIADSRIVGSTDRRDGARNTLDTDVELGVQGYVYPKVKYDTFIVGNPADNAFGVEEGYLTYQGVAKGLNINVGRKFAPFGRTGELHPHSWLYSRQFIARQSLVAGENLVGNGVNLNYLLPTGSSLFVRASLGYFTAGEEGIARVNQENGGDPFGGEFPTRPGSGLRKFTNARLWAGKALSERDEFEIGTSYANGTTSAVAFSGVDPGDAAPAFNGRVALTGYDVSFRRFLPNGRRLLLRGEYFGYKPNSELPTRRTSGYYGLANLRLNAFNDIGLLAERTGYPQAPDQHETAYSLIYTRQFNERYYVRLMGTNGDRPGEGNYSEVRLQFVAGLGPHTHELE